MNLRRPNRALPLATCALAASAAFTGCGSTQRTITVTSDPPGAEAYINDVAVGVTPLEVDFDWFGTYSVRLHREGYEPLVTTGKASPKLHDVPGPDLVAAIIPGTRRTNVHWHYTLTPTPETSAQDAIQRARDLQERVTTITTGQH